MWPQLTLYKYIIEYLSKL